MFTSERIHRAPNASWPAVEHMGVNHSRLHIFVTQKLLHGADVIAAFEQVTMHEINGFRSIVKLYLCHNHENEADKYALRKNDSDEDR